MEEKRKTMVLVFAGPNGSGKSTITSMLDKVGTYINADDIKRTTGCTDLAAAEAAEKMRKDCLAQNLDFTFETVLSTDRNLNLLKQAKEQGYFIKSIYVFTNSPQINVSRVRQRVASGGHGVPKEKIISRYERSLKLLPELIRLSDICNVYDNTLKPYRIFSKKKESFRLWENVFWDKDSIMTLTGHNAFNEIMEIECYYFLIENDKQLESLKSSGIPYKIKPTTDGSGKRIVCIDSKDKETALACCKPTHMDKKKR